MVRVDIEKLKRDSNGTRNVYNTSVQFGNKQCEMTRPDTFKNNTVIELLINAHKKIAML